MRTAIAVLMIGIAFCPAFVQKINLARANLARPLVELKQPSFLKGMKVSPTMADYVAILDTATRKILDKAPDTPIVMEGDDALYCVFANNLWNPSPYYVTWTGLGSADEIKERRKNISQRRPIVCFQNRRMESVDAFKQKERYVTIAEIPFQPVVWWWGGQHDADLAVAGSPMRSMVVVAPEELVHAR